jgi:hypothetical protein
MEIRWLGHVLMMEEEICPKQLYLRKYNRRGKEDGQNQHERQI